MAKFEEPFEDTQALYNRLITAAGLDNFVNVKVSVNNKAKELFKVSKANDYLKYRTNDDVSVILNEKIFEGLTPEQKIIAVEESLSAISFDVEKDTLTISKPDVVTFSGVLSKHTFETWNALRESIKTLYAAEKEEEDKIAALKTSKTKKKF